MLVIAKGRATDRPDSQREQKDQYTKANTNIRQFEPYIYDIAIVISLFLPHSFNKSISNYGVGANLKYANNDRSVQQLTAAYRSIAIRRLTLYDSSPVHIVCIIIYVPFLLRAGFLGIANRL